MCPYHAWAFNGAGECVDVPSSGPGAPIPSAADLEFVAVRERYGLVWLCPGTSAGGQPEITQDRDPSFRRVTAGIETWRVSATRMVDNFCDSSMFTFVSWRNHDHELPTDDVLAFDRAIGTEDRVMLERIGGVLPFDQSATVSVRSDRLSVEWRRRFVELLLG